MPSKPEILFIVSTFNRFKGEMQNPWMLETLRRLRDKGYGLQVLAPAFKGLESHAIEGFPVHRFRYFFKRWETLTHDEGATNKIRGRFFLKLLFFPYLFLGMWSAFRFARRNHFNVIHAHWPFPHGLMALAAKWGSKNPKPKIVLSFYGAELLLVNTYGFLKSALSWTIKKSDAVVSISNFTAGEVDKIRPTKQTVIPFGTPLKHQPFPLPENSVKEILTVGRIIERKGIEFLIRAMPLILKSVSARLFITGSGDPDILASLSALRAELGLERHVIFCGKLSEADLIERYRCCDLFCLPSIVDSRGDTEGLGVVLLEAMNYARPVVASAVGGITDIVKDGKTGLLCREKDPADLAEKILLLLKDRILAERLAKQGCEFAKTEFGWDGLIDRWDKVYSG